MSPYRNRPKKQARPAESLDPAIRILVVCEGAVTEKEYLEWFKKRKKNELTDVKVFGGQGVPLTLVDKAKEYRDEAAERAKRKDDAYLGYDEIWCVFDVDEHPNVPDAIERARSLGIETAVSNPSFELWLLLHLRESPGCQTRQRVRELLRTFWPNYQKSPNVSDSHFDYEAANRRAERLHRLATERGDTLPNPSTGVYRLTERIAHAASSQLTSDATLQGVETTSEDSVR